MPAVRTMVYSSFTHEEEKKLKEFKKEAFYFVGEDISNFNFWTQFFNIFFIYHYDMGDKKTVAMNRELEPAVIMLYFPSLFSKMKGEEFFTGEKLVLQGDEETNLNWFKKRELILSLFSRKEDGTIHFAEAMSTVVISLEHLDSLKKLKKFVESENRFHSNTYLLFLISLMMLKKERYASSKIFNPFTSEELMKIHLYYEKFAELFI